MNNYLTAVESQSLVMCFIYTIEIYMFMSV